MRLLDSGPDLPSDLIRTQLSGDVLFVVGAGVSKRVGLPLFDGLAASVYAKINQATPDRPETLADVAEREAWERKEWDRLLGLLEKRIVYPTPNLPVVSNPIRAAVEEILQPVSSKLDPFKSLLTISSDSSARPRIVTTNFDTLFERAWRRMRHEKPRTFSGPGLPAVGSPEFYGIIHLHGRIHDRSLGLDTTEFVLTSADFGEAYLRSGWASRFVYDLLRRYTLVFVGYAADDPPMRYMLEATEAGRLKFPDLRRAYSFAEVGLHTNEGDVRARWRAKGLEPILFNNSDGSYDGLYDTLAEWAEFAKDRRGWAETIIKNITSTTFAEATAEARAKVQFLVDTVSDTDTLAKHAVSPDWLECRISKGPRPEISDRDAIVWMRKWVSDIKAAEWAMTKPALSISSTVASGTDYILDVAKPEPSELLQLFWKTYRYSHADPVNKVARPNWISLQKRLKLGEVSYFTLTGILATVAPALFMREPWKHLFGRSEPVQSSPQTLSDLCRIEFECEQWPKVSDIISAFPAKPDAQARLLTELTSKLATICGLAADVGSISSEGDAVSGSVKLIHAPSAEDMAPALAEPTLRGGTPNHPDDYNHSFAPMARLMSGLWTRIAKTDEKTAASLAKVWIGHNAMLIRRLGYWAASTIDQGLVMDADAFLRNLDRTEFWRRELSAEAARFWCQRWNGLSPVTRSKLESNIRRGPQHSWIWSRNKRSDRREIADRMAHKELRRIATAGGKLSPVSVQKMHNLERQYPRLGKTVPLYEGLYSVSWSSSGPTGNPASVATTPVELLLSRVDAAIAADPFGQSDLWSIICRDRLVDAFAALKKAGTQGNWPVDKWRGLIDQHVVKYINDKSFQKARITELALALISMPLDKLTELLPSAGHWFFASSKAFSSVAHRRIALRLWDRLESIVEAKGDDLTRKESSRNLANASLSEPAGQLADVLSVLQDASPKKAGLGLAPDLAPRFDRLVSLASSQRMFALARFVQSLAFFYWLAPDWSERNLFAALDADTQDAKELLETLVLYGNYNREGIFARLKNRIFTVMLSEGMSSDAQDRLASLVTWMTIRSLSGKSSVAITEMEARQLLTRAPRSALRSVAWSLWRDLGSVKKRSQKRHWERYIKPFFQKVWPNDVSTRDAAISENLARIPSETGTGFLDAVNVISELIVPFKTYSVSGSIGGTGDSKALERNPDGLLQLAIASIDLSAPAPYDLQQFLDDLAEKKPALKSDVRYQKLNALLHGG